MNKIMSISKIEPSIDWNNKIKNNSFYLRSSWILNSIKPLSLSKVNGQIRKFDYSESRILADLISRKNLFQRLTTSSQVYVQRALELGDSTIIEIFGPEHPDTLISKAEVYSDWIEKVCVLVFSLTNDKGKLHNSLQIKKNIRTIFDLTIGKDYYNLRTKIKKISTPNGIPINDNFISRYLKCGFNILENVCFIDNDIHKRIEKTIKWLYESRIEPVLESAIVKTAIAMESLLIFDDSESLSKSLSERISLLITKDLELRLKISLYLKKFYEARSGIVHGGKRKLKYISLNLLEGIDRIVILASLIIIHNLQKWDNIMKLRNWFENEKFGKPDEKINIPFSKKYVNDAIKKIEKDLK